MRKKGNSRGEYTSGRSRNSQTRGSYYPRGSHQGNEVNGESEEGKSCDLESNSKPNLTPKQGNYWSTRGRVSQQTQQHQSHSHQSQAKEDSESQLRFSPNSEDFSPASKRQPNTSSTDPKNNSSPSVDLQKQVDSPSFEPRKSNSTTSSPSTNLRKHANSPSEPRKSNSGSLSRKQNNPHSNYYYYGDPQSNMYHGTLFIPPQPYNHGGSYYYSDPRRHFCKYCRRQVSVCSWNPCEKIMETFQQPESPKWILKDGQTLQDLEDSFPKIQSPNPQKHKLNFSKIPEYLHSYLIGRGHQVSLKEYVPQGMIVQFLDIPTQSDIQAFRNGNTSSPSRSYSPSPSLSHSQPHSQQVSQVHSQALSSSSPSFSLSNQKKKDKSDQVMGLVQWSVFPKEIQEWNPEDRLRFSKERVPIGSKFSVYVNGIENENQMILTLSIKPSLVLNLTKGDSTSLKSKSKFRYLIIVDLEATCDFSPSPVVDHTTTEIIEFPWVVLDTETLEFTDQRQLYVKPENLEGMTPYCRVLTGITVEEVSNGLTLAEAIQQFDSFVATLPPDSFRILTDGVWDLQVQLKEEAQRKNIPLAKWYQEYFDLKEEFRQFLPWFPFRQGSPPLHVMLKTFNLEFIGKHHSGFDDCFSIAQIVRIMIQKGYSFENPTQVLEECDQSKGYVTFSSYAPPDSWICLICQEKFSGAIWNPPTIHSCRFCSTLRTSA